MFKAIRISILLLVLFFVSVSTYLTQARSTDWNNSLWVKVYPINADGSQVVAKYIDDLELRDFETKAKLAGATEYFPKPLDLMQLIECFERILSSN